MSINRRRFLSSAAALSALGFVTPAAATYPRWKRYPEEWTPHPSDLEDGPAFRHGVASGDPLRRRVVLWTRVTPRGRRRAIPVRVIVARKPDMSGIVATYKARALQSRDYTVKVDAAGLRPDTTYYYRFIALGEVSPIGRTRTLPFETDHIRLGLASCSNYPFGFFTAYGYMAEFGQVSGKKDLNAIVHVGDYIYEYANGEYGDGTDIGRIPSPNRETVELSDYRWRYGQYRMDPNLQEAHRLHPWIVAWDDHESTNDAYKDGAENHDASEGDWDVRKLASRRAWLEWLPVRDPNDLRLRSGRIFRRFRFGDLAQLDMLDTRIFGREQQVPLLFDFVSQQLLVDPNELFSKFLPELDRPDRQLLGARQERWLFKQIAEAEKRHTKWQVLGQQIMMGQLSVAVEPLGGVRLPLNTDQWDGYPAARARLLDTLGSQNIDNTLVLTGDFHSSWCNEISLNPYDGNVYNPLTSTGSQAVEFVCPGITSPFFTDPNPAAQQGLENTVLALNPHTKYVDIEKNGYVIVDIDNYRARAEWWHLNDRRVVDSGENLAAVFEVQDGSNRATRAY